MAEKKDDPPVSEDIVNQVQEPLVRCPRKSMRRAYMETQILRTALWRVVRKRLRLIPYKLQMNADDREKRK